MPDSAAGKPTVWDVLVVGAGASGMMCASRAAARGLSVLLLEKGPKVGLKILVSGGGRCNFTNMYAEPTEQFLSSNPPFCISAMSRFQPWDFIALVDERGIAWHEKKLGQLFCDDSAKEIAGMLLNDCQQAGVRVRLQQEVRAIAPIDDQFDVVASGAVYCANKVVLASGGLSLPKIASDLAFRVANQLGVAGDCPSRGAGATNLEFG